MSQDDGIHCIVCNGDAFSMAHDEWMRRTFKFVEDGQLKMCAGCGAKYLVCGGCGGLYTRIHPALESWEINLACPKCGYEDVNVKAWDGVSAR